MKQLDRTGIIAQLVVALFVLAGSTSLLYAQATEQPRSTGSARVAVDLNTASQAELEALPGVDAVTAKKIISARPYTSVDDLSKIDIPPATIEKLRPMVKVGPVGTAAGGASRGASEAAKGVEKGASAAAKGTEKGIAAGTKGVEKGAEATGSAMRKVREKVTGEPAAKPPAPGMVWVDATAGVYYTEEQPQYGRGKDGRWMTRADALSAGYTPAPPKKDK